ncbi:MAG: ribokinase [Actinobacteria bacterium]|nr:ribokinase [Actinomycetota bacterium]
MPDVGNDQTFDFDVCVVGSANLDLVATVQRLPGPGETVAGHSYAEYPGGKGLNQAVAAARAGAKVAFVGAVGDDAAGATLRGVLTENRIADQHLAITAQPTGRALIGVSATGENSIIVVAGANATVSGTDVPRSRVVLAQLEVSLPAVEQCLATARAAGSITVLNPAPAQPLDESILRLCDFVIPNEHEVAVLGGADRLLELGARAVVVTLGSRGADLYSPAGVTHVQAFAVTPIDTTAAGDSFCGALCARLAARDELPTALSFAAAAGALCTTKAGAVPSIPTRAAIESLIARPRPAAR